MHETSSQTGMNSAMLRFSQRDVPMGNVPSIGSELTGSRSPSPSSIGPITVRTNAGASSGIDGAVSGGAVT